MVVDFSGTYSGSTTGISFSIGQNPFLLKNKTSSNITVSSEELTVFDFFNNHTMIIEKKQGRCVYNLKIISPFLSEGSREIYLDRIEGGFEYILYFLIVEGSLFHSDTTGCRGSGRV